MSYVIYHKESTYYMPGMKRGGYKAKWAAVTALNKTADKITRKLAIKKTFDDLYRDWNRDFRKAAEETMKSWALTSDREVYDAVNANERDRILIKDYAIADDLKFHNEIEKMVTRVNLMSRKEYQEIANTPISCSPAFETYWSM